MTAKAARIATEFCCGSPLANNWEAVKLGQVVLNGVAAQALTTRDRSHTSGCGRGSESGPRTVLWFQALA
jgi:hypothetical protein